MGLVTGTHARTRAHTPEIDALLLEERVHHIDAGKYKLQGRGGRRVERERGNGGGSGEHEEKSGTREIS